MFVNCFYCGCVDLVLLYIDLVVFDLFVCWELGVFIDLWLMFFLYFYGLLLVCVVIGVVVYLLVGDGFFGLVFEFWFVIVDFM